MVGATGRVGGAAGHHTPRGPLLCLTEKLAGPFALFDAAGYATDSPALRESLGVEAMTAGERARRVSLPGSFG